MRKLIIALLVAAGLAACSDFHTSDNGHLDGLWQLCQVDTLENGRSEDARHMMIFWSVQASLLEMQHLPQADNDIFFRFELAGGQLRVYDPIFDDRAISDRVVTDPAELGLYGLQRLDETFKVLRLDGGRLTLQNDRLRLYFRKY